MGLRWFRCTGLLIAVVIGAAAPAAAAQTGSQSDVGPASLGSGAPDPNLGVADEAGRTLNFDGGWRFKLVNTSNATDPSGVYGDSSDPKAAAPGFPDTGWERVTLPHDWSITQLPRPDQSNATGYFPGGLGWYRKTFRLPSSITGKRISIDFDGVFDNSYVYLNGHLLGNHPYGYTGYSFDVSKLIHTAARTPNVVAVVVQNQEPSSRWYSGSGITRHVHLTVTDPIHIARWGTSVTTPNLATTIRSRYADVHVATQIANDGDAGATVKVVYKVKDPSGKVVARARLARRCAVKRMAPRTRCDLRVAHPELWSTTHPAPVHARDRCGRAVAPPWITPARHSASAGWRSTPDKGVFLNGRPLKLHGVDLHNDEGALGSVDNYDALCARDEQPQGDGRQRVPHVSQPALARADRHLPALWES